jgi:hypothetical protein
MLIGFTGKKKHGKDTAAKLLAMALPKQQFKRLAFADKLKREICNALQIDLEFLELNKEKLRPLLQAWGEMRRNLYGENYWITSVADEYYKLKNSTALITDTRYYNEAIWIKKNGGILVRVVRPGFGDFDPHKSETELDKHECDYTIHAKTLEELQSKVNSLINNLQLNGRTE